MNSTKHIKKKCQFYTNAYTTWKKERAHCNSFYEASITKTGQRHYKNLYTNIPHKYRCKKKDVPSMQLSKAFLELITSSYFHLQLSVIYYKLLFIHVPLSKNFRPVAQLLHLVLPGKQTCHCLDANPKMFVRFLWQWDVSCKCRLISA